MDESYDAIPYQSIPFTDSHPENLATLGALFGLAPPDPARARVLELGCASGGNLIPLAWYLPDGDYLGIDLSARQIADGRRLIAALGRTNVKLEQCDIMALGDGLGTFDYIVAHGVYSWVPPPVQARILELCARHLAPQGVAYISYNTWPGWHMRGMLRDMLLYAVRGVAAPDARLARARQFLQDYAAALADSDELHARYLRREIARVQAAHPSYLYHEYLESSNQPHYVADFIAGAEAHGLQYLCDAELKSMFPSVLGTAAEHFLDRFEDLAEQEQQTDFLVNRTFRQSLLCRGDAPLTREIDLARLERLAFFALLRPPAEPDLRSATAQGFADADGQDYSVTHPLTKAALLCLAESHPDAVAFAELAAAAAARLHAVGNAADAADTEGLLTELFMLFAHQAIGVTPCARRFPRPPDPQPRAHALARAQAAAGSDHLATARHSSILLDAFSARMVDYLDGSRTLPALIACLADDLERRRIPLAELKPATPAQLRRQVEANVRRLLKVFAQQGILAAPGA